VCDTYATTLANAAEAVKLAQSKVDKLATTMATTTTPVVVGAVDTKEDDPTVTIIVLAVLATVVCCGIVMALVMRTRAIKSIVLTFSGAASHGLTPDEIAELQGQAINVVVAHSHHDDAGRQGGIEKQEPRVKEDDIQASIVLTEEKEAEGQDAATLEPEEEEVLVDVVFQPGVKGADLEMTFKNLLGAAAAGRGDGCGIDESAKAQAACLPVTIAVGSKLLTLVLASKDQPPKKNKPVPQGAAELVAFENPAFAGPDDGAAEVEVEVEASDGGYLHVDTTAPKADEKPKEAAAALSAPAALTAGLAEGPAEADEESEFGFGAAGDSAAIEAADDGAGFTF